MSTAESVKYKGQGTPLKIRVKGLEKEVRSLVRGAVSRRASPASKYFILYGLGRSGSTLMVTLMNNHPQIGCLGETLHSPAFAPVSLVKRQMDLQFSTPCRGFKLLSYHMRVQMGPNRTRALRAWVEAENVAVINVRRENVLRIALSNIYARARDNIFHSHDPGAEKAKLITVDPAFLMERLEAIEGAVAWEQGWIEGLPRETVVYERDLVTPEAQQRTMDRVFASLGMDPVSVSTNLRQVTPRNFESFVANWDEIADRLKGTRYETYFAG